MKRLSVLVIVVIVLGAASCGTSTPAPTNTPEPTLPSVARATDTPSPTATPTVEPTATATPTPTVLPSPTPTPTPPPPSEIAKSVVRIDMYMEEEGRPVQVGHGSGSVLNAEGLILTNAHVVRGADELVVCLTSDADLPPTPSYYAEPVAVDYILDLALIQITADIEGNEIVESELDLPTVGIGSSDDVDLGQRIRILGYPGIGLETITLTEGTVGGFVSEDLGDGVERVWVKTDTDISPGNSGGAAVNELGLLVGVPTAGRGSEVGTLGYLRPVNLGTKYVIEGLCPPLVCDASVYEPNDAPKTSYGPLKSKVYYTAYIHENDLDFYTIEIQSLEPIEINLTNIADDVDYDLGLVEVDGEDAWLLDISDGEETSSERILYSPSYTGTYYVLVGPYEGYSLQDPYVLQVAFDGDVEGLGNVTIRGRILNANTDRPIEGAVMFLLVPGVTGEQFIESGNDESLVQVSSITDAKGVFVLEQVPRGTTYAGFIATGTDSFWQNAWLNIEAGAPDEIDLGDLYVRVE